MKYDILVNGDNPIDETYLKNVIIPSLVPVDFERDNDIIFDSYGDKEKIIYLEKEAAKAWESLKNYVREQGIRFDICSGFLSIQYQTNKYNDFLSRNGLKLTRKRIALPGFSEHHTGLAIDCDFFKDGDWAGICSDEFGDSNSETKFIHSILPQFGFILRFPADKSSITNMQYEPWHIRYVGIELAKELTSNNLTLEECHQRSKNNL